MGRKSRSRSESKKRQKAERKAAAAAAATPSSSPNPSSSPAAAAAAAAKSKDVRATVRANNRISIADVFKKLNETKTYLPTKRLRGFHSARTILHAGNILQSNEIFTAAPNPSNMKKLLPKLKDKTVHEEQVQSFSAAYAACELMKAFQYFVWKTFEFGVIDCDTMAQLRKCHIQFMDNDNDKGVFDEMVTVLNRMETDRIYAIADILFLAKEIRNVNQLYQKNHHLLILHMMTMFTTPDAVTNKVETKLSSKASRLLTGAVNTEKCDLYSSKALDYSAVSSMMNVILQNYFPDVWKSQQTPDATDDNQMMESDDDRDGDDDDDSCDEADSNDDDDKENVENEEDSNDEDDANMDEDDDD